MNKIILSILLLSFSSIAGNSIRTPSERFNQRYGFWFVFESTCSSCIKMGPILKDYANLHRIYIRGLSKDAKPIPTWDGFWTPDKNATIYRLGAEKLPTPYLILRDSYTQQNLPIGIGQMTHEQLTNQIYQLTQINLEAE